MTSSQIAYAIAHIFAILACARARRFPLWGASLVLAGALSATWAPESGRWLTWAWAPTMAALIVLRLLAAMEAFWAVHRAYPHAGRLCGSLIGLAIGVTAIAWHLSPDGTVETVNHLRRYANLGGAVFLLLWVVLIWAVGWWRWDWAGRHAAVLLVIYWRAALVSLLSMGGRKWTNAEWRAVTEWDMWIGAGMLVIWTIVTLATPADRCGDRVVSQFSLKRA